jgi:hypothetical protein
MLNSVSGPIIPPMPAWQCVVARVCATRSMKFGQVKSGPDHCAGQNAGDAEQRSHGCVETMFEQVGSTGATKEANRHVQNDREDAAFPGSQRA